MQFFPRQYSLEEQKKVESDKVILAPETVKDKEATPSPKSRTKEKLESPNKHKTVSVPKRMMIEKDKEAAIDDNGGGKKPGFDMEDVSAPSVKAMRTDIEQDSDYKIMVNKDKLKKKHVQERQQRTVCGQQQKCWKP